MCVCLITLESILSFVVIMLYNIPFHSSLALNRYYLFLLIQLCVSQVLTDLGLGWAWLQSACWVQELHVSLIYFRPWATWGTSSGWWYVWTESFLLSCLLTSHWENTKSNATGAGKYTLHVWGASKSYGRDVDAWSDEGIETIAQSTIGMLYVTHSLYHT